MTADLLQALAEDKDDLVSALLTSRASTNDLLAHWEDLARPEISLSAATAIANLGRWLHPWDQATLHQRRTWLKSGVGSWRPYHPTKCPRLILCWKNGGEPLSHSGRAD